MAQRPEHAPGEPAPAAGTYEQLNIFGRPIGIRVNVTHGHPLPPAPQGQTKSPTPYPSRCAIRGESGSTTPMMQWPGSPRNGSCSTWGRQGLCADEGAAARGADDEREAAWPGNRRELKSFFSITLCLVPENPWNYADFGAAKSSKCGSWVQDQSQ